MKWVIQFFRWILTGETSANQAEQSVSEAVEAIQKIEPEKLKEKSVISSKQVSDDIRDIVKPETLLNEMRNLSSFTRIDVPDSEDILKELKKISEQVKRPQL